MRLWDGPSNLILRQAQDEDPGDELLNNGHPRSGQAAGPRHDGDFVTVTSPPAPPAACAASRDRVSRLSPPTGSPAPSPADRGRPYRPPPADGKSPPAVSARPHRPRQD